MKFDPSLDRYEHRVVVRRSKNGIPQSRMTRRQQMHVNGWDQTLAINYVGKRNPTCRVSPTVHFNIRAQTVDHRQSPLEATPIKGHVHGRDPPPSTDCNAPKGFQPDEMAVDFDWSYEPSRWIWSNASFLSPTNYQKFEPNHQVFDLKVRSVVVPKGWADADI